MRRIKTLIILFASIVCFNGCDNEKNDLYDQKEDIKIELENLKTDGKFQYYNLQWNSEIEDGIITFGEIDKTTKQNWGKIEKYQPQKKGIILGHEAEIALEYFDKHLSAVTFNIQLKNPEETAVYAEKILQELEILYGERDGDMKVEEGLNISYWQAIAEDSITSIQLAEDTVENCTVMTLLWEIRNNELEVTVSFSDLKNDDVYCYAGIPWNTSKGEIEQKVNESLILLSEINDVKNYQISGKVKLMEIGVDADVQMEFWNDKLKKFKIEYIEKNSEIRSQSYQEIIEQFENQYGEVNQISTEENRNRTVWYAKQGEEETILEVIDNDKEKKIQISVGVKDTFK